MWYTGGTQDLLLLLHAEITPEGLGALLRDQRMVVIKTELAMLKARILLDPGTLKPLSLLPTQLVCDNLKVSALN